MFQFVLITVSCLALTNADIHVLFVPKSEEELLSFLGLNKSDVNEGCIDAWEYVERCYQATIEGEYHYPTQLDIYNASGILRAAGVLRNFSDCLGDSSCAANSIPIYVVDASIFIVENLFGDAYDCLSKSNIDGLYMSCAYQYNGTLSVDNLPHGFKEVSYCVADLLPCSHSDFLSFLAAVDAGVDLHNLWTNIESTLVEAIKNDVAYEAFDPEAYL
uniref:DUF19 domain-containing protein n=1 Tax=Caenorhabditis japonica TaxID=281687 RepID=A0A8R1IBA5_CAEJA